MFLKFHCILFNSYWEKLRIENNPQFQSIKGALLWSYMYQVDPDKMYTYTTAIWYTFIFNLHAIPYISYWETVPDRKNTSILINQECITLELPCRSRQNLRVLHLRMKTHIYFKIHKNNYKSYWETGFVNNSCETDSLPTQL